MLLCKEKINIKICNPTLMDDLHMFFDRSPWRLPLWKVSAGLAKIQTHKTIFIRFHADFISFRKKFFRDLFLVIQEMFQLLQNVQFHSENTRDFNAIGRQRTCLNCAIILTVTFFAQFSIERRLNWSQHF